MTASDLRIRLDQYEAGTSSALALSPEECRELIADLQRQAILDNEVNRHPAALAWERFTQAQPELLITGTLGNRHPEVFLKNRLWRSFMEGWQSCADHYRIKE